MILRRKFLVKARWTIEEELMPNQATISVRQLLHQQWLLPNRFIHYLRSRHQIEFNHQYRYMNKNVYPGDKVTMHFYGDEFRTAQSNYRKTIHPQLKLLYENRYLLVVNKPAGQKTHPNQPLETGTLMNDVAGYLAGKSDAAYMVHRIDQATSGALIVAKNPVVVPVLDRLIATNQIHREYLAVVNGEIPNGTGCFDWPIGKDPDDPRKRKVSGLGAQPAVTFYQTLGVADGQSLVKLRLATGRTHQIRVHLAYSGHPIVGDPLYGNEPASHMLLHGRSQRLVIPFKRSLKQIFAPIPAYFPNALVKYDQKELQGGY